MRLRFASNRARRLTRRAFTLAEMMVSMGVFSLTVLGLIYAQLAGMRYDQLVASKLGASETSRRSFDLLTTDIRSAKIWSVGNGNQSSYTPCGNGMDQQGNAIQLCPTTETNSYVRYYFDEARQWLCRTVSDQTGYTIIAQYPTNTMSFRRKSTTALAQDLQYKYVIATTLEFAQYQYPLTRVGPSPTYLYNYYRLQLKAASHCPN